jgi:predicted TPR repeat methyltransferase/Flp pilus assembly protein TadD
MRIQLPAAADIHHCLTAWRAEHPQLDVMLSRSARPALALRILGIEQWSQGRLDVAVRLLSAAAGLEPEAAAVWGDLAGAYYAMNCPEEARACVLMSLDKDGRQPASWLLLATIQSHTQNDAAAEIAFSRAIELDPRLEAALAGLGLLHFRQRRFKEAAERLEAALALGSQIPLVRACLGQALFYLGEFREAAGVFAIEASINPENPAIIKKLAQNRFLEALQHEDVETALAIYAGIAGPHAEDRETVTRTAYHLLTSYGYLGAAMKLGRARLAWAPDDPVQRYLLDALEQAPLSRAPHDYIVQYFDRFAETFDTQLADVLGYRVPEDLTNLLAKTARTFADVLDLGCGTGLAGPLLRPFAGTLTGADLSPRMLEKAAARGVYDRLIETGIESFLGLRPAAFDLIFASDVLIYFGDLSEVMHRAAQALKPGGVFAFSIERAQAEGYALLRTGRFAHHPSYIEELAKEDFAVIEAAPAAIRLDAGRPVDGVLYVLQRHP